MIDVFVVGILVALVQVGNIMTIRPGVAAVAFAGMVVTTMLASLSFDPRLLWAQADQGQ
jgi:paraquat-inducible protein A